jgi:hypothetical protein
MHALKHTGLEGSTSMLALCLVLLAISLAISQITGAGLSTTLANVALWGAILGLASVFLAPLQRHRERRRARRLLSSHASARH